MGWTHVGTVTNEGLSSSPSITHGLTINDGDLVYLLIHVGGGSRTITPDETWNSARTEVTPAAESATYESFWLVASSEPSSYGFDFGASDDWAIVMKVLTPDAGTPEIDAGPTNGVDSGAETIVAVTGITVADESVAIATAMMDNRSTSTIGVDNSYVNVADEDSNQLTAIAHRLFATGAATGTVTFSSFGISDAGFFDHISFISPGVVITDVDTDEAWSDGDTGLVITGTGFVT